MSRNDSLTLVSLLRRLRSSPDDPAAWRELVSHYGPKIYRWCRKWGVQDSDAYDVTQTVLLKLTAKLREFDYDPARSFRAWLKTLTHYAWLDQADRLARPGRGSGDVNIMEVLNQFEARQSLTQLLSDAYDQELLEDVMARVQLRVERRTWEAFRLLAIEGWSGADAARHLKMKVMTVFVARSKIQRMIREEITAIESAEGR